VSAIDYMVVLVGGVAAGAINVIVGSGTLITFPILLTVGYAPVTANVANTIGLVPGSLVGAYGYREELAGQWRRILRLVVASIAGGIIGAVLLLTLPTGAFKAIVPAFIVIALVLVVIQPWIGRAIARRGGGSTSVGLGSLTALLVCGIYGGYFGAAQGIIILAVLGLLAHRSVQHANGIKNVLAAATNLVAGIIFIFAAHVEWVAAGLIAVGAAFGGYLGAKVGRRLSPRALRGVIIVVGCVAIVRLVA
jgi:uncharacterized protein